MMQAVMSSGTSEAGYIASSEAAEEFLALRQKVKNFMELSMRISRFHRRDVCDAGKVRVVCVKTWACSLSR